MRKILISLISLCGAIPMSAAEITLNPSADNIVCEIPEDAVTGTYIREGEKFSQWGADAIKYETLSATLFNISEGTDGKIYLGNSTSAAEEGYLVGAKVDNTVTFQFPQTIRQGDSYLAVVCLEPTTVEVPGYDDEPEQRPSFKISEKTQEIVFTVQDGKYIQARDVYFGYVQADGQWAGYGEYNLSFLPFESKLVVVPEGTERFDLALKYEDLSDMNGDPGIYKMLEGARKGNDIFVKGLSTLYPESWIKGKIDGDQVVFENGQFMGIGNWAIQYLCTGYDTPEFIPGYNTWEHHISFTPSLTMGYDAERGEMTMLDKNDLLTVNSSTSSYAYGEVYANGRFKSQSVNVDPTPIMPVFKKGVNTWDNGLEPFLTIQILPINIYGDLLDTSNLGFEVEVDGEPYVFTAWDYWMDEDMEIVPWLVQSPFINMLDNGWTTIQFEDTFLRNLKIRTVNKIGEKIYYSDYQTPDNPHNQDIVSGIKDSQLSEAPVISTSYYDLSGKELSSPESGIIVMKSVRSDGSVSYSKIMR
ncbi:MAG: hypothetical protein K2N05_02160 [Muribaculaceae bacterium]|nr:hypothetical protein [Muribaculaceae bacterium]